MALMIPSITRIQDLHAREAVQALVNALNAASLKLGVDARPQGPNPVPAPLPPLALSVVNNNGAFQVIITENPANGPRMQYELEASSDAAFTATTTFPLGNALAATLNLGFARLYWRVRAKYQDSDFSGYVNFGAPTLVHGVPDTVTTAGTFTSTVSPLTQSGVSTTINIASRTLQIGATQIPAYNSGSVNPGSFGTWYIYGDDPDLTGGAITYFATATPSVTVANKGRVYFGEITTVSGGGAIGFGGGTGGGGPRGKANLE